MDSAIAEIDAPGFDLSDAPAPGEAEVSPDQVRLCLVPVEHVAEVLEEVAEWIESAMLRAAAIVTPMELVRAKLEAGDYRLMLAGAGDTLYCAAVLEVTWLRQKKFLFVVAAGGVSHGAIPRVGAEMWRGICGMAKRLECDGVRLVGRPGWARWLRRQGAGVRVRVMQVLIEAK